jgi:hypothetical protein
LPKGGRVIREAFSLPPQPEAIHERGKTLPPPIVALQRPRFWPALDWLNEWNFKHRGEEAGYLDLSYYDLLDSVY